VRGFLRTIAPAFAIKLIKLFALPTLHPRLLVNAHDVTTNIEYQTKFIYLRDISLST
jgi:hypothetical protein